MSHTFINKNGIPKNDKEIVAKFKKELKNLLEYYSKHIKIWKNLEFNHINDKIPKKWGKPIKIQHIKDLEEESNFRAVQEDLNASFETFQKENLRKLLIIEKDRVMNLQEKIITLPSIYNNMIDNMYRMTESRLHTNIYANLNQEFMDSIADNREKIKLKIREKIKNTFMKELSTTYLGESLKNFYVSESKKKKEKIFEVDMEDDEGKNLVKSLVEEAVKPLKKTIKEQNKVINLLKSNIQTYNGKANKPIHTKPIHTKSKHNPNPKHNLKYIPGWNPINNSYSKPNPQNKKSYNSNFNRNPKFTGYPNPGYGYQNFGRFPDYPGYNFYPYPGISNPNPWITAGNKLNPGKKGNNYNNNYHKQKGKKSR